MAKFTVDDKLSAVKRYLDDVESFIAIGRAMGTSESVIMNWVKQYK
jgi:transposase